jgi:imidazolonepropionase-like amidohydrolase
MNMKLKATVIAAGCLALTCAAGYLTPAFAQGRGYGPAPQTGKVVAIKAGRMFDAKAGRILSNQVILITGDKITDVGPNLQIPAGATTIDLSRATVLPGMVDGHLHLSGPIRLMVPVMNNGQGDPNASPADGLFAYVQQALKDLHAGVTSIVELGGTWDGVTVRNAINNGVLVGPRMMVAGPNFGVGGTSGVDTPEKARAAVREWKQKGADWIKLHTDSGACNTPTVTLKPDGTMTSVRAPAYTLEIVKAVVDEAHKNGMKVADHVYGGEALDWTIEAHTDAPQHVVYATPAQLAKMKAQGQPAGMTLFDMAKDDSEDTRKFGNSCWKMVSKGFANNYKAGVTMEFSSGSQSDATGFPHGLQGRMLEYYVKFGVPPAEAIKIATINTAEIIGWGDKIGSIEKGKYADIISVPGDPLQDITLMAKVAFVMKGGDIVRSAGSRGWGGELTPPKIDLPPVR